MPVGNTYHVGMRQLQDRFGSRLLADRLDERLGRNKFTAEDRAFIESRSMFFLASADAEGQPDCSYKGGDPGFVRITADDELAFPSYDGNGMFRSLGNVLVNAAVGLLFIDFESPRRLRVNGVARIADDDDLLGVFTGAQLVVRVRAQRVFSQLLALHPQQCACGAVTLRAASGLYAACAEVEDHGNVRGRAAPGFQ